MEDILDTVRDSDETFRLCVALLQDNFTPEDIVTLLNSDNCSAAEYEFNLEGKINDSVRKFITMAYEEAGRQNLDGSDLMCEARESNKEQDTEEQRQQERGDKTREQDEQQKRDIEIQRWQVDWREQDDNTTIQDDERMAIQQVKDGAEQIENQGAQQPASDDQGRRERDETQTQAIEWLLEQQRECDNAEKKLREVAEKGVLEQHAEALREQEEQLKRWQEEADKRENERIEAERRLREEAKMAEQVKQALERRKWEERERQEAEKRENAHGIPKEVQQLERNDNTFIKPESINVELPEGDDMWETFNHPDSLNATGIGLEPRDEGRPERGDIAFTHDGPNAFGDQDDDEEQIVDQEDEDLPDPPQQPLYDHRRTRGSNLETMADFVDDFQEYYAVHSRTSIDMALDCIIAHRLSNSRATNPYNVYLSLRWEDPDEQERLRALGIPTKGGLLMNLLRFTSLI
jgi:hypothetical protein